MDRLRESIVKRVGVAGGIGIVCAVVAVLVGVAVIVAVVVWRRRRGTPTKKKLSPPPPPPVVVVKCKPSGRFSVPFYTGASSDSGSGEADARSSPAEMRVKVDFATTCDAVSVSWQYASGLRGQPAPTSDYSEFHETARERTGVEKNVRNPGTLRGNGWLRLVATYDDGTDIAHVLSPPLQLPPTFSSTACYNVHFGSGK